VRRELGRRVNAIARPGVDDLVMATHPRDAATAEVGARDLPSFDALFAAERGRVVATVFALAGSAAVAEEITQEAFLRLHLHWAKVSRYDRPDQWVRRVAVNLAVSRRRRRTNEEHALRRLGGRTNVVTQALDPRDDALWTAVRALPKRQAQAVALHYVADLAVAEIATVLGCTEGTVQTHLFRARQALAGAVDRREEER
jgi:RNA polymerase sigma factor (sigma-70 family)